MRVLIVLLVALGACAREDVVAAPVLTVSAEEVTLGGERVVLVKDALRFDYLNLPELEHALGELRASRPGTDACADVRATPAVRFGLVKRLLMSCAAHGAGTVTFRLPSGLVQSVTTSPAGRELPRGAQVLHFTLAADAVRVGNQAAWRRLEERDDRRFAREVVRSLEVELNELDVAGASRWLKLGVEDGVAAGQLLEVLRELEARRFLVQVLPASW